MTSSRHIIIAEDEELVAIALACMLESHGFRVTVTRNGQEALEAEAQDPADILLTDMRMPVLGGRELIQRIRQRRPDLPVVVMTGFSESIPAEEPGRTLVLNKPFQVDVLFNALQAVGP